MIMTKMTGSCRNTLSSRRKLKGWSQEETARRSGLSRAEISAIETGRVVPSTVVALELARAFNCPVEQLFSLGPGADSVEWAWQPSAPERRFWRAEVGGRNLLYPSEHTAVGLLAHDGVARRGELDWSATSDPRNTLVIAGCDPSVGLLQGKVSESSPIRLLPLLRSSRKALDLLARGLVHGAGLHWSDPGNETIVRRLLGSGFKLLHLVRWEEGIVVDPSLGLSGPRQVLGSRLSWVGREEGSGARRCMDRLLGRKKKPAGYDRVAADHRGVVEIIRGGWAQAGVCVRPVADEAGLGFFSVQVEDYEICYRADAEADPRFAAFLAAVRSIAYRRLLSDLPGCQTSLTGQTKVVE